MLPQQLTPSFKYVYLEHVGKFYYWHSPHENFIYQFCPQLRLSFGPIWREVYFRSDRGFTHLQSWVVNLPGLVNAAETDGSAEYDEVLIKQTNNRIVTYPVANKNQISTNLDPTLSYNCQNGGQESFYPTQRSIEDGGPHVDFCSLPTSNPRIPR